MIPGHDLTNDTHAERCPHCDASPYACCADDCGECSSPEQDGPT